jgi:hypothetical protein
MATVVDFSSAWDRENSEALASLIERHDQRDILGVAYVVIGRNGHHEYRASGQVLEQPELASGLLNRLVWSLMSHGECGPVRCKG